ncbi:MAG: hypothetical protein ACI318_07615 [Bacilli bacterium]
MKKSKLLVISALALSGVLASCGGNKPASSSQEPASNDPAEKVTVRTGVGMVKASFSEKGELSTYIGGAVTDGTKVLATQVDCLVIPVKAGETAPTLDGESKYVKKAVEGQSIISKLDLGPDYGMGEDGYKKNCDAINTLFATKTIAEAANVSDIEGVTIVANDLIASGKEAIAYSVKDVITSKPQAGKDAVDNSAQVNKGSTLYFGLGYSTSFSASKAQMDITIFSGLFKEDGTVVSGRLDVSQYKFAQDAEKVLKTSGGDLSKQELGTDYHMGTEEIDEVYVQMDVYTKGLQGMKVTDLTADTEISGCTVSTGAYVAAAKDAFAKKVQVTA